MDLLDTNVPSGAYIIFVLYCIFFRFCCSVLLVEYLELHILDYFSDMAANLNSFVSNNYYGMLREERHTNLPPEHFSIQVVETTEFKMVAVLPTGLEIATNTVANATNFFSLATKIVV